MTLTKVIDNNISTSTAAVANGNWYGALSLACQNHIRQLMLAAQTYGVDKNDLYGDGYSSITGRNNTVSSDNTLTVAKFDTNKYKYYAYAPTATDNGLTYGGAFNPTSSDFAYNIVTSTAGLITTLSVITDGVDSAKNATVTITGGGITGTKTTGMPTTNGATFTFTLSELDYNGILPAGTVTISLAISGRAVRVSSTNQSYSGSLYSITNQIVPQATPVGVFKTYAVSANAGQILHTLPAGTFSSGVTSAYFKCLVANTETGASIQYKLQSAGADDTGWINDGEVANFSAFSSQPTKLIVKLIPKGSGPTAFYPAIYGVSGISL